MFCRYHIRIYFHAPNPHNACMLLNASNVKAPAIPFLYTHCAIMYAFVPSPCYQSLLLRVGQIRNLSKEKGLQSATQATESRQGSRLDAQHRAVATLHRINSWQRSNRGRGRRRRCRNDNGLQLSHGRVFGDDLQIPIDWCRGRGCCWSGSRWGRGWKWSNDGRSTSVLLAKLTRRCLRGMLTQRSGSR